MDSNQAFINAYEKEYKKTNRILLGMILAEICFIICAKIIFDFYRLSNGYIYVIFFLFCLWLYFFLRYKSSRYSRNANKIVFKYKEDLDIDFALSVFEKLLENKRRLDLLEILYRYLDFLFYIERFDMFEEVYQTNRNVMKLPFMKMVLKRFITNYLSLLEDRSHYKKQLFQYRFTRWHKAKGDLSDSRKIKRFQDESFEVLRLYEAGEYQKAIEKIDQMHIDNPWDQLRFQAEKEKCLYHLGEKYDLPKEEDSTFLFVKQWKTLVETGKEYTSEYADKMLPVMKKDLKSRYGLVKFGYLPACIFAFLFVYFFSLTLSKERLLENYVRNVESWEIEVSEVRAFYENKDMSAAVIYAKSAEDEEPKQYYLANVDYFTKEFVPMLRLDIQKIYDVSGTNVYITEGDYSTYIAVVTEKPSEIIYDGKMIEDVKKSRLSSYSPSDSPYLLNLCQYSGHLKCDFYAAQGAILWTASGVI